MTRRRIEELGDLLDRAYNATLATRRPDGDILLSPVWFEWRDGGFNVGIPEGDVKLRHLALDPRCSIVVYDNGWPSRGFEVRGIAQFRPEDRHDVSLRLSIRYLGEERGREYAAHVGPGVIVRLEPGAARGWDFRDEA